MTNLPEGLELHAELANDSMRAYVFTEDLETADGSPGAEFLIYTDGKVDVATWHDPRMGSDVLRFIADEVDRLRKGD